MKQTTGEQLRDMQKAFAEPLMKRIAELEAENVELMAALAKAHEYGYQYRQERNSAETELAALKVDVMPRRGFCNHAAGKTCGRCATAQPKDSDQRSLQDDLVDRAVLYEG